MEASSVGQWKTFAEGKEAIEFMPLAELEAWSGKPKPDLLPFSGWSIPLGVVLFFVFSNNAVLQLVAFLVALYGVIAVLVNSGRAKDYKAEIYRRWVQDKALEMDETNKSYTNSTFK